MDNHDEWSRRNGPCDAVYTLSEEVIEALEKHQSRLIAGGHEKRPLIKEQDAQAERVFLRTCNGFSKNTVGVWMGEPISYPLLRESNEKIEFPNELIKCFCDINTIDRKKYDLNIDNLYTKLQLISHQLIGYAGQLTFDDQYRREVQSLKAKWTSLPEKPSLKAGSAQLLGRTTKGVGILQENAAFYDEYARFIQKWDLVGLATWDLPIPQGPLRECPAGLIDELRGPGTILDYYPKYYDIPSNERVRDEIRTQQRREGQIAGIERKYPITNTSPRNGTSSELEKAFRMWLIEETIHRRYAQHRGTVARLLVVFAEVFSISQCRIKKIRQTYTPFLTR